MSYTELHFGKLKPIQSNMRIEDLERWLENKEDLFIDDFEYGKEEEYEYFEIRDKKKKYKEPMSIKYIYNKGNLYEMLEYSGEQETDDLDMTIKNEDGTINFTYMFYNGGTYFGEMLEEGLNRLDN